MPYEGLQPEKKAPSAAAEARAGDFSFDRDNKSELAGKRVEAINAEIAALQTQRVEGLEKSKGQTDPRLIQLGEVLDEGFDKEITRLVAERNKIEEGLEATVQ